MTAILLIAAIVGLVWAVGLATRGSLLAGCTAYLLLTCCLGVFFLQFDVAGVTFSLDRIFLVFLVAAFVLQWRLGQTDWKPLLKTDVVLLTFVGLLAVSMGLHDWNNSGPADVPIVQHLINGYLIPLVLYWIARQAALSERNVTAVLGVLTLFGLYLAVVGLLEVSGQWSLVFPRYIRDPELGLHYGRARGPMMHSVSYGLYLGTSLLCLWLWRERWSRWQLVLVPLLGGLMLAGIYYSKTRSVWVGAATGLMVVLAFTLKGRTRAVVLGSMLLAGLLVGVTKMDSILGLQREGTVENTRKSASMRGSFAYVSWTMFQDRPLFGFGFGQFAEAKLPYLSDRSVDLHLEAIRDYVHHNTFLSVLTETGLVGLALLLAVYGGWIYHAWQLVRDPRGPPWVRRQGILMLGMLGIVFWQMVGHEISFTTLDHALIFTIAGLTVGLRAANVSPRPSPAPSHVRATASESALVASE